MRGPAAAWMLAVLATTTPFADSPEPEATPETPKDVGLVERASTRLAQLDVSISGPKGSIEDLTAADFEVVLDHKQITNLLVDDLCVPQGAPAAAAPPPQDAAPASKPAVEAAKPSIASYLLFFDMPHLTQSGRRGAIDAARDMLPKLLAGGNQAMLVANAAELKTVVPFTSDVAALDAALAKMVNDSSTFDTYASLEPTRMAEIIHEEERGVDFAISLASRYAADEKWQQQRDLRQLSMVLGRLSELDAPKSVLYFADTMRQNPGEHYLAFFSGLDANDANGRPVAEVAKVESDAATGAPTLDRVIDEASGLGIRFYTIEGQGMQGAELFVQSGRSPNSGGAGGARSVSAASLSTQRTRDAQTTLGSMAAETGGRAFLNGFSPNKMAAQILGDLSCMYLLSFDPKGFKQDAPLVVSVVVKRPGVKASVRGRLVIQSDSTRLTGKVLAAFAAPTAGGAHDASLHVGLIPISYKDGSFKARVQVAVPGTSVPATTWDIGASLVSKGVVWQDGSGRVQVSLPNTAVVYEKDMDFAPGEYDLVAVAHETQTDTMASKEVRGSWPKIDAELATLAPISVSQPLTGGFLRNGQSRTQGAVVVSENEPLRGDAPTAVITLVCRAKDQKRPLKVVRTLVGETTTKVGTTQLDLSSERCGQVVDLIPPKTLGAGRYQFIIAVSSDGNELVRGERTLVVPERTTAPVKAAS
jgi:VWFA-related protein